MRVRLLPSMTDPGSQLQNLTTFLVNEQLAIDGGSLGFALTPDQMPAIRHIVITHAHSDHTASLPIFVAEAFTDLDGPLTMYAIPEVISALKQFVFNDKIWPDFEKIRLMNRSEPTIRFQQLEPRRSYQIAGLRITPIPVNHIVPTVGMIVQGDRASVVFTSDTYVTDEIWLRARQVEDLKAIFVDVSYPNELAELAASSKHLTPMLLASELKKLDRDVAVYAVHIKPRNREKVLRQLEELNDPRVMAAEVGRIYEW